MADEENKLSDRQRLFAVKYVSCLNATRAAIDAGYSEKTARAMGHENLTKPNIRAEVDRLFAERSMSKFEVVERITQQARSDYSEFWEYDAYGAPHLNFKKLQEAGLAHLVKEIEFNDFGRISKLKFADPQAALRDLGRHHKLFTDKSEISGPNGDAVPVAVQFIPYVSPNSDNS